MTATGAPRLPRRPDRRRLQLGLLAERAVERVVRDAGGRREYVDALVELVERHAVSVGAADAAVRRALARGDVLLARGDLVLPALAEAA